MGSMTKTRSIRKGKSITNKKSAFLKKIKKGKYVVDEQTGTISKRHATTEQAQEFRRKTGVRGPVIADERNLRQAVQEQPTENFEGKAKLTFSETPGQFRKQYEINKKDLAITSKSDRLLSPGVLDVPFTEDRIL